jgi:hypothetical protein
MAAFKTPREVMLEARVADLERQLAYVMERACFNGTITPWSDRQPDFEARPDQQPVETVSLPLAAHVTGSRSADWRGFDVFAVGKAPDGNQVQCSYYMQELPRSRGEAVSVLAMTHEKFINYLAALLE